MCSEFIILSYPLIPVPGAGGVGWGAHRRVHVKYTPPVGWNQRLTGTVGCVCQGVSLPPRQTETGEALEDALEDLAYRYNAEKRAGTTRDGLHRICRLSPTRTRKRSPEPGTLDEETPIAERDPHPDVVSPHLFDSSVWFAEEPADEALLALAQPTRASSRATIRGTTQSQSSLRSQSCRVLPVRKGAELPDSRGSCTTRSSSGSDLGEETPCSPLLRRIGTSFRSASGGLPWSILVCVCVCVCV